MKNKKTMFNGLPLNENQTCTYYYDYTLYDPMKVYGPASFPQYFDNTKVFEQIIYPTYETPEVYITKNKSRLKKYEIPYKVYLNDGDEFEIELFNTTTFTLGVKIKFHGEYISQSHLILEPGTHFFLDRYLDTNNKFKFSTYQVDANNSKVDNAIRFNGDIEIEFYKKIEPTIKPNDFLRKSFGQINQNDIIGNNCFYSTSLDHGVTLDSMDSTFTTTEFKGTGRVDKGSESDQEFDFVDMSFQQITLFNFKFKILPNSQKPIEIKDLKPSCSGCKRKSKKNDKFCSHCGTKY